MDLAVAMGAWDDDGRRQTQGKHVLSLLKGR